MKKFLTGNDIEKKASEKTNFTNLGALVGKENNIPISEKSKTIGKKKNSPKKTWKEGFVMLKIEPPYLVNNEKYKKKYAVRITFLDDKKVRKHKTVMFGEKDKNDFVDDKDLAKKASRTKMLRHADDPFHKDFWKLHLLNSKENVGEAYTSLLGELNLL